MQCTVKEKCSQYLSCKWHINFTNNLTNIWLINSSSDYQVTPVSLQEVLSVGTGTFVDESVPSTNKVDIRVLSNIKQLSYQVLILSNELIRIKQPGATLDFAAFVYVYVCVTVQLTLNIPEKYNLDRTQKLFIRHALQLLEHTSNARPMSCNWSSVQFSLPTTPFIYYLIFPLQGHRGHWGRSQLPWGKVGYNLGESLT